MMFSNKDVKETLVTGNGQKYIYGGIYHNVTISNVKGEINKNGTPTVTVTMHTEEGGPSASRDFNFYMSDSAKKMSQTKLKHMATKVAKESDFNNIEANTIEEYGNELRKLMAGTQLRMKFIAEQYRNTNGELKDKADIGLPPFAEAIMSGAEYDPVLDENTELTYDKNNQYDYKPYVATPTNEATAATSYVEDQMQTIGDELDELG